MLKKRSIYFVALVVGTILPLIAGANFSAVHSTNSSAVALTFCPFCSSVNPTIAEQLDTNDIVAVVKLKTQPPEVDEDDLELPKAKFEITKVLKGDDFVVEEMEIETILIGSHEIGDQFMVMGVDPPSPAWSTPIRTNQRIIDYFEMIPTLPAGGPDRLAFFQEFFEDEEDVLSNDAYDEFALAPYEDVIALKDRMHHKKLIEWIQDEDVLESRKRLYFTMLGVCGTKDDVPLLERLLKEEDREKRPGLDAMSACYLRIMRSEGLPLIEELFLANREAEYIDVFSVIQALRFHSTETDDIPKERIAQSMRLVLDHPKIADIVIPDLARLEDWSIIDRLADMFRNAGGETKWVRTPIATYMQECPDERAKDLLEEFRKIDADAVKRAELMANFELFDDEEFDDEEWDDEEMEEEEANEDGDSDEDGDDDGDDDGDEDGDGDKDGHAEANDEGDGDDGDQRVFAADDRNRTDSLDGNDAKEIEFVSTATSNEPSKSLPVDSPESVVNSAPASLISTEFLRGEEQSEQPVELATNTVDNSTPASAEEIYSAPVWGIIAVPLGVSVALFALLWSVINGWFERLIF